MARFTISLFALSGLLLALVATAAFLLLQACRLNLPFAAELGWCQSSAKAETDARLAALTDERAEINRLIFEAERELGALQCEAIPYDTTSPLDDDFWRLRDLGWLYGCWDLDTTYRTRDVDTGKITTYSEWRMCFDAQGNGTQVMRGSDGVSCEGPVSARFGETGLGLIEPGNLPCGDGGYIHQREIACVQAAGGGALCSTLQPETGGAADVAFSRAPAE